jgi:hypothetical protein
MAIWCALNLKECAKRANTVCNTRPDHSAD